MENIAAIGNQLNSKELFEAFKIQLKKDFEQSNFSTEYVDDLVPDYTIMHEQIVTELLRNEKRTDFNVMRLLNRIDISEPQLKRYLAENKNESHFNVVAELVIKRVLQKVVIKQFYKNKEK